MKCLKFFILIALCFSIILGRKTFRRRNFINNEIKGLIEVVKQGGNEKTIREAIKAYDEI